MKPESASIHAGTIRDAGVVTPIQPSTAFRYLGEGDQPYPLMFLLKINCVTASRPG